MKRTTEFIETQGLRLLTETDQPRRFLRAEDFRSRRPGGGPAALMGEAVRGDQPVDPWQPLERRELLAGRVQLAGQPPQPPQPPQSLHRLVLTTDAGVGKTTNMRWLHRHLNEADSQRLALLIDPKSLATPASDELALVTRILARPCSGHEPAARPLIERLREAGRLTVLFDGLDQASAEYVQLLRRFLEPAWAACRLIISGRPHALQHHWETLFDRADWRFVQADEFLEEEQRRYLGKTAQGDERLDLIPEEAREILGVPRVLEYIRALSDLELGALRTPSDVYWKATQRMIRGGLESERAAELGNTRDRTYQVSLATTLLGAIAFEMTSQRIARPEAGGDPGEAPPLVPNFDRIPAGMRFDGFCRAVYDRVNCPYYDKRGFEGFREDLTALGAMNSVLAHGFFDTDGLSSILWRNRSLQEFFAALWMSQHCRACDVTTLRDWLYTPDDPLSEEYYWVWRYASEMPEEARDGVAWVDGMTPLFAPGDGTPATRRCNEMLYRCWDTMAGYARGLPEPVARESAQAALAGFQSEFEQETLCGRRGEILRRMAEAFVGSFVEIPAGTFLMGSPAEKQGQMPDDARRFWEQWLEAGQDDPEAHVDALTAEWSYPPGKLGVKQRANDAEWLLDVHRNGDLQAIVDWSYASDETPDEREQEVAGFQLSNAPTLNCWYRLYDAGHGLRATEYAESYSEKSGKADTPVIYVSWYDAWTFCQWARWTGISCRLPYEHEWEYAAKAATPWDWAYWWGEEFDASKCNGNRNVGHTTVPAAEHANPWELRDMLGNVLEWCTDWYRPRFSRTATAPGSARVLRGGSWNYNPAYCRSANRSYIHPSNRYFDVGFRVARALS